MVLKVADLKQYGRNLFGNLFKVIKKVECIFKVISLL